MTLIEDWLAREDYFKKLENEEEWWSFQFHSIWILCELKAVEAMPVLKKLLRQDDDFYWY